MVTVQQSNQASILNTIYIMKHGWFYIDGACIYIYWLVEYLPLWKYEFVSWDDDIPSIWKVIKVMFQTTNQKWFHLDAPWILEAATKTPSSRQEVAHRVHHNGLPASKKATTLWVQWGENHVCNYGIINYVNNLHQLGYNPYNYGEIYPVTTENALPSDSST